MVNTCSWLYGASQVQECPRCGDPLPMSGADPMAEHISWHCDDEAKSKALTVTVCPDTSGFQASIEQAMRS